MYSGMVDGLIIIDTQSLVCHDQVAMKFNGNTNKRKGKFAASNLT